VQRLDVTRATLSRVDLRGADLSGLDGLAHLRGAVISGDQLLELAPALAEHLGIDVVDGRGRVGPPGPARATS
jgi:uncharacterized protein YjbI with pentapeptide repeats